MHRGISVCNWFERGLKEEWGTWGLKLKSRNKNSHTLVANSEGVNE